MSSRITWPDGKDFAFTVFDDTDRANIENVSEVYSFLTNRGFRTTKSVWPIRGVRKPKCGGTTCDDPNYLEWLYELKDAGFEIGCHNATFHSSLRYETISGFNIFKELFGHYPKSFSNHTSCRESIYWGNYRLTGLNKFIYNLLTRYRNNKVFQGHIEKNKYFWGDICREKVKYVRNFVYADINTLQECPFMPYHDAVRPYVNYWFASSEGPDVDAFNRCINERNQDRLEAKGGACIMYTHFAVGFYKDGKINSKFKSLMDRLSKKNGWFVPVSTLLDHLLKQNGGHVITDRERRLLERKWLLHKIRVGKT